MCVAYPVESCRLVVLCRVLWCLLCAMLWKMEGPVHCLRYCGFVVCPTQLLGTSYRGGAVACRVVAHVVVVFV